MVTKMMILHVMVAALLLSVVFANDGNGVSKALSTLQAGRSLVIVSTLDGKVTALDATFGGQTRWSLPSPLGPLFSSSLSTVEFEEPGGPYRLIPSLDGTLYKLQENKLQAFPVTADALVEMSSGGIHDGSSLVGGKDVLMYGVDPRNGQLQYICSSQGCQLQAAEGMKVVDGDILVVKRVQRTVRALNRRGGSERWNFSVGHVELSLQESLSGNEKELCQQSDATDDWQLQLEASEGLIVAVGKLSHTPLWKHQFMSPIAAVWTLKGGHLKQWDVFENKIVPLKEVLGIEHHSSAAVFLGVSNGQPYIHASHSVGTAVSMWARRTMTHPNAPPKTLQNLKTHRQQGQELEFAVASPLGSQLTSVRGDALTARRAASSSNNYGVATFFYSPVLDRCGNTFSGPCQLKEELSYFNTGWSWPDVSSKRNLLHWWPQIAILLVVVSLLVAAIIKHWENLKPVEIQGVRGIGGESEKPDSVPQEDSPTDSEPEQVLRPRLEHLSDSFQSRYESDFQQIKCLGRGGFGKVFHVRNVLDDQQYAVKRVRLPSNKEERMKVLREVKALAAFDHQNIVRYFNSWTECPPLGYPIDPCGNPEFSSDDEDDDDTASYDSESPKDDLHTNPSNSILEERSSSHIIFQPSSSTSPQPPTGQVSDSESFRVEFQQESTALESNTSASEAGISLGRDCSSLSSLVPNFTGSLQSKGVIMSKSSNIDSGRNSMRRRRIRLAPQSWSMSCDDTPPIYLYIQMQLCRKQTLKHWLALHRHRDRNHCLRVFRQITAAVQYVHNRGLMHRDLKPSNVFFAPDGCVKVGDFGLATPVSRKSVLDIDLPLLSKGTLHEDHTSGVGTDMYRSPELMKGGAYSQKVDIYSLGVIFLELLIPFETQMERCVVLLKSRSLVFPGEFEKNMVEETQFLQQLLSPVAEHRPSAQEIYRHHLFSDLAQSFGCNEF